MSNLDLFGLKNERPPLTRSEVTRRVMHELRDQEFAQSLQVRRPDGSAPIVVALPTDRVSEVTRRIEAIGGRANLMAADERGFYVISVEAAEQATEATRPESSDVPVVHQDINMGMLIAYIEALPTDSVTFSIQVAGLNATVPSVHHREAVMA